MFKYLISQLGTQPQFFRRVVTHVFHNRYTVQLRILRVKATVYHIW